MEESDGATTQDRGSALSVISVLANNPVTSAWVRHFYFIVHAPNGAVIKAYLDTIVLLATLIFVFSVGHFFNIPKRDLNESDDNWVEWCSDDNITAHHQMSVHGGWCDGFDKGRPGAWSQMPSRVYCRQVTKSYVCLASAVILAVCSHVRTMPCPRRRRLIRRLTAPRLSVCLLKPSPHEGTQMSMIMSGIDANTPPERLVVWWRFYQWPMHVTVLLIISGIVYFAFAIDVAIRINFTDEFFILAVQEDADSEYGGVWQEARDLFVVSGTVLSVSMLYMLVAHGMVSSRWSKGVDHGSLDDMDNSQLHLDYRPTSHALHRESRRDSKPTASIDMAELRGGVPPMPVKESTPGLMRASLIGDASAL
jgi:hypothetical protein